MTTEARPKSSTRAASADHRRLQPYEIRVSGHLGSCWTSWFDGLRISNEDDGTTVISGPELDQAALHGVLQRVRDLGIPLVSVTRQSPGAGIAATGAPPALPIPKGT